MTASNNMWFASILKGSGLFLLILFLGRHNNDSNVMAFELRSIQSPIGIYSMIEPDLPEADYYLAQLSSEDLDSDDEDLDGEGEDLDGEGEDLGGDDEDLDGEDEDLDGDDEDLDGDDEDLDGDDEGLDEDNEDLGDDEGLGDDDMSSSEESGDNDDVEEETEFETQVKVKQKYKMMTGRSTDKRGFSLGSGSSDRSDEAHLINKHEIALRVRTSPASTYYFRLETKFDQKNDYIDEKYEDVYGINVREGYYNYQSHYYYQRDLPNDSSLRKY